jgi:predicted DCC family thiol-disulfide oxidoreductase YuxK
MAANRATGNSRKAGLAHLVLFDGDCGLCSRTVQVLLRADRKAEFAFVPLQGNRGRAILKAHRQDPDALSTFFVVADFSQPGAKLLARSTAALFIVHRLGWPWRMMSIAGILPLRIRDFLYDLVARHRHMLLGRQGRCLVPAQEFRDRFIDEEES